MVLLFLAVGAKGGVAGKGDMKYSKSSDRKVILYCGIQTESVQPKILERL